MFSRYDLEQALDVAAVIQAWPIEICRFGPDDFETPDSEQELVICRSPRLARADSLQFWLACLKVLQDEGYIESHAMRTYALAGRHLSLQGSEWWSFLRRCTASLRSDPAIGLQGRFREAMIMTDEWDDRSAICEADREYLAVFWGTTA